MKSFVFLLSCLFLLHLPEKVCGQTEEFCLSPEEQLLYSMIMDYRKSKKLPPIPLSAKLTKVAKVHAYDLTSNYEFDPENKCNPHSWSKKGKWSPCCYTNDHKQASCMWDKPKEIADYNGLGYEIAYYSSDHATAKEGLDGWKLSPGHNPLLINSGMWSKVKWNAIGIALYKEYGIVWFGQELDDSEIKICK
jgi:hypothetical protein